MTLPTTTTETAQPAVSTVEELIPRLAELQKTLGLSDNSFGARYKAFVGSSKTWKKLKEGTWRGHVSEHRILPKLQKMMAYLEAAQSFNSEEFIQTPFVKRMNANFERLLGSEKDRRCLICLAPEGVGKSWWSSSAVAEDPTRRIYLRISHAWREKPFHISRAMSEKLGAPIEKNPAKQMETLIQALRARPETIFLIDEGHNGGVALLKMMKDLIDETSVRFVYCAFPTEFDAVRSTSVGSMAEARQLFRRCIRPIFDDYRDGIGARDIAAFLKGSGFPASNELETVAATLAPKLARNQNLSTLADAVEEARIDAEEREGNPTLQAVVEGCNALCSTYGERRSANAAH